jgi:ssDNA-binding Zn-finger/Zn-ribbon topoisomerase 1
MSETEQKKKKRKKRQLLILEEQTEESPDLAELVKALEELEKEGKVVEIQVCPKCKSPRVRRVKTMRGDLWSHLGWTPPKFECEECGWQARLVLKATNKKLSVKDVEIIAEAMEAAEDGEQS